MTRAGIFRAPRSPRETFDAPPTDEGVTEAQVSKQEERMDTRSPRRVPPGGLRCGDADRADALAQLHRAFVEARLDHAELDERIGMVLVAKTYAELDQAIADLAVPPPPPLPPRPQHRHVVALASRLDAYTLLFAALGLDAAVQAHALLLAPLAPLLALRLRRLLATSRSERIRPPRPGPPRR